MSDVGAELHGPISDHLNPSTLIKRPFVTKQMNVMKMLSWFRGYPNMSNMSGTKQNQHKKVYKGH